VAALSSVGRLMATAGKISRSADAKTVRSADDETGAGSYRRDGQSFRERSPSMNAPTPHDDLPAAARLGRLLPLAGVGFAVLTIAGDLTIDKFPDSNTPVAKLTQYYATHHHQVGVGGTLLAWAAILLGLFGVALWARVRSSDLHPAVAGAVLLGAAVATANELTGASAYITLGTIGHQAGVAPAALQAWHISGSEGSVGSTMILLVAVGVAGILSRAIPRWLAWPALLLGIVQISPVGFFASLLTLVWAAATGIVLVLRPSGARRAATTRQLAGSVAA
jgi:hypothetical protein